MGAKQGSTGELDTCFTKITSGCGVEIDWNRTRVGTERWRERY